MNKVIFIFLVLSISYANALDCKYPKKYITHSCLKKTHKVKQVETKLLDTDPNLLNDGREPNGMLYDPYAMPRIWDPHWKVEPYIPQPKDLKNKH